MLRKFLNFIKRPEINEQNTGRQAFQQYNGYAFSGVNGNGGQGVRRSLRATNPATIVPGNSLVRRDPSQTGNTNTSVDLQPLTDENLASF